MTTATTAARRRPFLDDALRLMRGDWRIVREIRDGAAVVTGRFVGDATLSAITEGAGGPVLSHTEAGTLTLAAAPGGAEHVGPARARFTWRRQAGGVALFNAVDAPLCAFETIGGQGVHLCGADRYVATWAPPRLDAPDAWRLTWRVTGPAKNYATDSVFQRI